jgi:sensor histidine kinase regulating citrate/malate metabolism
VHVGRAVEELFSLAVERVPHDESVSATVDLHRDGDEVVVAVADDGNPIPEAERRCVERGTEEKLEHVSGVGLWLVYWTVTLGGGELDIDDAAAGGALVTCKFPACDRDDVDTEAARDASPQPDSGANAGRDDE